MTSETHPGEPPYAISTALQANKKHKAVGNNHFCDTERWLPKGGRFLCVYIAVVGFALRVINHNPHVSGFPLPRSPPFAPTGVLPWCWRCLQCSGPRLWPYSQLERSHPCGSLRSPLSGGDPFGFPLKHHQKGYPQLEDTHTHTSHPCGILLGCHPGMASASEVCRLPVTIPSANWRPVTCPKDQEIERRSPFLRP